METEKKTGSSAMIWAVVVGISLVLVVLFVVFLK